MRLRSVLFDLDGTLVDTAPDLVAVLNRVLAEDGQRPMPYAIARNVVSTGVIGLLKLAYGPKISAQRLAELRRRFLEIYAIDCTNLSYIFNGLNNISDVLDKLKIRWGIVTNKPALYTHRVLAALALTPSAGCVVSGDTLEKRKPNPEPLYHAAELLDVPCAQCVYVGDSPRDIEAGRAAGMVTVAAAYGYIRPAEDVGEWGADVVIRRPDELSTALAGLERLERCL
jgi:2-phosphoglycolate phosphatase